VRAHASKDLLGVGVRRPAGLILAQAHAPRARRARRQGAPHRRSRCPGTASCSGRAAGARRGPARRRSSTPPARNAALACAQVAQRGGSSRALPHRRPGSSITPHSIPCGWSEVHTVRARLPTVRHAGCLFDAHHDPTLQRTDRPNTAGAHLRHNRSVRPQQLPRAAPRRGKAAGAVHSLPCARPGGSQGACPARSSPQPFKQRLGGVSGRAWQKLRRAPASTAPGQGVSAAVRYGSDVRGVLPLRT